MKTRTASRCAGLVLLWLAACVDAPEPATLRLLDLVDSAQIAWPRGAQRHRPQKAFLRAVSFRSQDARRVGRMILADGDGPWDNRAALAAPVGSVYRFEIEVPARAELRLALGVAPPRAAKAAAAEFGSDSDGARFLVSVEPREGAAEVVLDEVVSRGASTGWVERRVDLSGWSGERVTLSFETAPPGESGSVAWAGWGAPEVVVAGAEEPGWDLLLISLDTLRADRLGSYGYSRPTSPHLDALAASAIRFEHAISASPWTNPSHRSMLTGIYPQSNGGIEGPRLAQVLRAAGYRTTAFTGGGQLDYRFGFSRGFDEYRHSDWLREPERVVEWFEGNRERRRFVFLHTYEIHDPYLHGELAQGMPRGRLGESFGHGQWLSTRGHLSEEEQRYVAALYDGGIAWTDRRLAALLDDLGSRGLLERTVVVITSDHGEQFFEHGSWRHGMNLYDEQVRVPLIVRLPPALAEARGIEAEGRVISEQVSLVDLFPTLLDLLEVERDWPINGRTLLPLLAGEAVEPLQALSENTNIKTYERKSLRTRRYKYIHSYPKTRGVNEGLEPFVELFDLDRDPAELDNLAAVRPDLAASFEELLAAIHGAELALDEEELDEEELDPDLRRRLEALGYLGN